MASDTILCANRAFHSTIQGHYSGSTIFLRPLLSSLSIMDMDKTNLTMEDSAYQHNRECS